jgi:prevent-host-death family protein
MAKVTTTEARRDFGTVIDKAYARNERVVIVRNGRSVAAIVPMTDFEELERREQALDERAVATAIAEQGKKKARSWDDVKAELGLG